MFLELMESIFGPVPIDPVNNDLSIVHENSSGFNIFSDVKLL